MVRISTVTALLLASQLSFAGPECEHSHSKKIAKTTSTSSSARPDIVDVAVKAGSFKTLAAALTAAGLIDTLKKTDNLTVFAPTDEAFAKLPEGTVESLLKPENLDQLQRILSYHVIPARVPFKVAAGLNEATALSEDTIAISLKKGSLYLNDARVIDNDIQASNGIIHVIDTVLIPEAANTSSQSPVLRIINSAISKGVPLFNQGQIGACAAVYELAAEAVLEIPAGELSDAGRDLLSSKLKKAQSQSSDTSKAWTLRYALDATIALVD